MSWITTPQSPKGVPRVYGVNRNRRREDRDYLILDSRIKKITNKKSIQYTVELIYIEFVREI